MEHKELADLLPLAALGRLEPDEAAALGEHLREDCSACRTALRAYREATAALAMTLEDTGSEHRVWGELEARLHTNAAAAHSLAHSVSRPAHLDHTERRSRGTGWWRALAATAAAAAIALAFYNRSILRNSRLAQARHLSQLETLNLELHGMESQLGHAQDEVKDLHGVLLESAKFERMLMEPDVRLLRLMPLQSAPGANGLIAISAANRHAMIQASGLPPTPEDKTYELWWLTRHKGPIKAALFGAGSDHTIVASALPPPRNGDRLMQAAVTLEPAGGASVPTGETYLRGSPERE